MIGTRKLFLITVALAAKAHAAVSANVLDNMNAAVDVANHDDRALAQASALEVSRVGNFSFQANVAPVLGVEEAF